MPYSKTTASRPTPRKVSSRSSISSRDTLSRPPLEAAGLEHRRAGSESELQVHPRQEVEQVGEREAGREEQRGAVLALARRKPGARLAELDAARAERPVAALAAEAAEHVVDHEAEARLGRHRARRHQREHRGAIPSRQAESGEGGVDRRPVEVGERVAVDAGLGAQRAARAEGLERRVGRELDRRERRRRHERDVAPGSDRRRRSFPPARTSPGRARSARADRRRRASASDSKSEAAGCATKSRMRSTITAKSSHTPPRRRPSPRVSNRRSSAAMASAAQGG